MSLPAGWDRSDVATHALDHGTLLEAIERARPAWHANAACAGMGPALFFVERGGSPAPARAVCAGCSVRAECTEYGRSQKFGLWGGQSTGQIRRRQRERRARIDSAFAQLREAAGVPAA